jgi:arabinofuranosyltransferase
MAAFMSTTTVPEQLLSFTPLARHTAALGKTPAITRLAVLLIGVAYLVVVVRTAWLGDDAYIALRTVDNFVNGRGLTWNVAERVQTFTCPLWVLLVSAPYYFTREPLYTTVGVSLACSLAAVAVVARTGVRAGGPVVVALLALLSSKAFVDFSTSGLENPLTNLLLALFFAMYFHPKQPGAKRLVSLALVAALAAVNRLDTILFYMPPLALVWWSRRDWRATGAFVVGFLPLASWLTFAWFYYGFAFPNTAYAKLHAGIPAGLLALNGFYYYCNSLSWDPTTLPCIALGLVASLTSLVRPVALTTDGGRVVGLRLDRLPEYQKHLVAAAGILLYLAYIVRIGGDFMSGRFFAAPLLGSCALISAAPRRWPTWLAASIGAVIVLAGAWPSSSSLRSGPDYCRGAAASCFDGHAIGDERGFYYPACGMLRNPSPDSGCPAFAWLAEGHADRAKAAEVPVVACYSIGMRCFHGGPNIHYVDRFALGDPLLSRLPACNPQHWKVGHFERALPLGYLETLRSGHNVLEDPRLRAYYDRLSFIIRGDLLAPGRIREIIRMALGRYDCLLAGQPPELQAYSAQNAGADRPTR